MVSELAVVEGVGFDPYQNLALEQLLLERVQSGQCILYLWQNARTVVIGRNQSALAEVRVAELEAADGHLARRLSGGGAVFHDLGNLNFTFVCRQAEYDVDRQTEVILQAVRSLNIDARRTGRNDLVVDAGKFSGHAYYRSGGACLHHGTLMVDVDVDEMGRYLRPSAEKLQSKGVGSVRSRVVNLSDLCSGLDVHKLAESLQLAFSQVYGLPLVRLDARALDASAHDARGLDARAKRFAARSWLFRDERAFEHRAHARFAWGEATLRYELEGGAIGTCALDSDGLEADYLERVPHMLENCPATARTVKAALMQIAATDEQRAMAADIAGLMNKNGADTKEG